MIEQLVQLLNVLNGLSPLAVIALLGTIILLMVHRKGPLQTLKNNHLEHVQKSLDRIVDATEVQVTSSAQQVDLLVDIKSGVEFLKGRSER